MPTCPKCGSSEQSLSNLCGLCGTLISTDQAQHPHSEIKGIAWESIQTIGIPNALQQTIKQCLLHPSAFFSAISNQTNFKMAFFYALVIGSLGSLVGFIWTYILIQVFPNSLSWLQDLSDTITSSASMLVWMPVLILLKLVFSTVYFQILLFITRSKKSGITSTFSVVCYAESTGIFNLIPIIGSAVSFFYSLYLYSVGFSKVHRISLTRSFVITLLPLFVLGVIGIILLVILAALGLLLEGL